MSRAVAGGLDYALLKRHYDCDDYIMLRDPTSGAVLINGLPFTATEDYYVVGTMAYLNDPNVIDYERGWCTFKHGQPGAPNFLAPYLTALGVEWPSEVPAFEAKDLLFYSDQDCWIRFEGENRVQHFIPANTFMRFHRRCFMFFVQAVSVSGNCKVWMEG